MIAWSLLRHHAFAHRRGLPGPEPVLGPIRYDDDRIVTVEGLVSHHELGTGEALATLLADLVSLGSWMNAEVDLRPRTE